jgi:hypothetical protein
MPSCQHNNKTAKTHRRKTTKADGIYRSSLPPRGRAAGQVAARVFAFLRAADLNSAGQELEAKFRAAIEAAEAKSSIESEA